MALSMGPTGCPETSVRNYYYTLRNIPEERRSLLLHSGSLKSTGEIVAGLVAQLMEKG